MGTGSAQYMSSFCVKPALRSVDQKRVFVQQGSSFGHGWECDQNSKIWWKRRQKS